MARRRVWHATALVDLVTQTWHDGSHERGEELDDVYVVSDLHLGRGKNPDTGRFFELECFFYDDDFRGFCMWLCEQARAQQRTFTLVLNGDTFDFLRLDKPAPSPSTTMVARQFGPAATPAVCAEAVTEILEGHPKFVNGIVRILAEGHRVIFLPGNHDIEIQWAPVQRQIRRGLIAAVREQRGEDAAHAAESKLAFLPWFYYEPGRVWVEHGCQYDPENAFEYPLRAGLADSPDAIHEAEFDLPMGNFFQRYLYNAFGSITFIVPTTRAHLRYAKWLIFNQPRQLARIVTGYWSFWWQVVRRFVRYAGEARHELAKVHAAELDALAESAGLGDKLRRIDGLKDHTAGVAQTLSALGRQALKIVGAAVITAFLVFGLWFSGFHGISQLRAGFIIKALLFLMLDFGFLFAVVVGLGWAFLRTPKESSSPLRRAAQQIATELDVPVVTFGHTHDEVLWRLDRPEGKKAWYYNTGTWLAVFTHDVLMPRERVQFTFLKIRGHSAELLHWSPGRGESVPVILLDEKDPQAEPRRGAIAAPG